MTVLELTRPGSRYDVIAKLKQHRIHSDPGDIPHVIVGVNEVIWSPPYALQSDCPPDDTWTVVCGLFYASGGV